MPERLVITNTTPLLYLHRIRRLPLLPQLYGQVHVPLAVAAEFERGRAHGWDVPVLADHGWLRPSALPDDAALINVPDLGPGESEVLALAVRNPGCLVLMDDALGRQIARLNGVTVTGTGGVLLRAKRQGLVPSCGKRWMNCWPRGSGWTKKLSSIFWYERVNCRKAPQRRPASPPS